MRQRITPGATLDIPTLDEIQATMASARSLEMLRAQEFRKLRGSIQLNATGAGQATEDVSPQYDWVMERVTIAGAGAVSALVQLFIDEIIPSAMVEVIQLGAAGLYSDGFSNSIHVPANSVLYISVTTGVANGNVSYNLQVKQVYKPI